MAHQQGRGPGRAMVAEVAWVGVDDRGNPGVDLAAPRAGPARPRGVRQLLPQAEMVATLEPLHPVVDRAAADAEGLGDLPGSLPLVEPEERLGATSLLGRRGVVGEVFQLQALPG